MPSDRARRCTRCIEKNAVEFHFRFPGQKIGLDHRGLRVQAGQVFRQDLQAAGRVVKGGDVVPRGCGWAFRPAQRKDQHLTAIGDTLHQLSWQCRGRILNPPVALGETWQQAIPRNG